MFARCPECDANVAIEEAVVVTELVSCPQCAAELELVALDPPALALAPEIEEDWGE